MHWTYAPGIEPYRPQRTGHTAAQAHASLADRDAVSRPVSAGVVRIWTESLAAFAAHSGPILILAGIGFGGVVLLGCLADLLAATSLWALDGELCRLVRLGWPGLSAPGPLSAAGGLSALSGGLCLYGWNPAVVRLLAPTIPGFAAMALPAGPSAPSRWITARAGQAVRWLSCWPAFGRLSPVGRLSS